MLTAKQKNDPRRPGLLAKVHIAIKDLDIPDSDYRAILTREFGKRSAADLTILELQWLVEYFRQHGWEPKGSSKLIVQSSQIQILRVRAEELAGQIENGPRRLRGLVKKFCGVEDLKWVRQVSKLKRILAALQDIKESNRQGGQA